METTLLTWCVENWVYRLIFFLSDNNTNDTVFGAFLSPSLKIHFAPPLPPKKTDSILLTNLSMWDAHVMYIYTILYEDMTTRIHGHMYVYMCICIRICILQMYAYTCKCTRMMYSHTRTQTQIQTSIHTRIRTRTRIRIRIRMWKHAHAHAHIHVHAYAYACACAHTHIRTHTNTHKYDRYGIFKTCKCACLLLHVCTYACVESTSWFACAEATSRTHMHVCTYILSYLVLNIIEVVNLRTSMEDVCMLHTHARICTQMHTYAHTRTHTHKILPAEEKKMCWN